MELTPRWWQTEDDGRTARCSLCFHACRIPDGGQGICGVRSYAAGVFSSPYLGRFSAVAIDPIEKKPLLHWRPGTFILSLGSVGCNMNCHFCQNHSIALPAIMPPLTAIPPSVLLAQAREAKTGAVAYTYNEPTLQAEYILATAPLLKEAEVATVLVTNGMIAPGALRDLAPLVDAVNIDVKVFDEAKYAKLGGSLNTVKATVETMLGAGVHVELTNLVVPGISDSLDDFERMVAWIASLSAKIPLHISRCFPAHKHTAPATSLSLLHVFREIAKGKLSRVHLGNVQ